MTMIIGRIRKNEKWINLSYYVLYAILYLSALVGTTTFMDWEGVPHVRNLFYMGATAGMFVLWILGLVLQENWKINVAKAVILLSGILQFALGGGSSLILILTILIGATDRKSADIILKESLIIGIAVIIIAYLASMNGYIEYKVSTDGRHSFGFTYYSHFSDKLLYLYMMFRCVYRKRLSVGGYALSALLVYLDFRYTHARTVTICFVLFLLLCAIYDLIGYTREKQSKAEVTSCAREKHGQIEAISCARENCNDAETISDACEQCSRDETNTAYERSRNIRGNVLKVMGALVSAVYVLAGALSFGGVYVNKLLANMEIPYELNTFIARLNFSGEAMKQYGFTFFGQKIYESLDEGPYFYLDNAYIRLFFITGAVTLVFFAVYMTWMMWHAFSEKQYILFFALLVAATGGISETYTINFYYNVFAILAFARLGCIGTIPKREKTI